MHNRNLPVTLSPCVSIFLEILWDEAFAPAPVDWELLAAIKQAQPVKPICATEAK
jgi:hypothetical protein